MKPELTHGQCCLCTRPKGSGRINLGWEVCLLCGLFIVTHSHAARLARNAEIARAKSARWGRKKMIGGLQPIGIADLIREETERGVA